MNKKLKIIIFVQVFVVVFLLGILLGMKIQKDRMTGEVTTTEANVSHSNEENSNVDTDTIGSNDGSNDVKQDNNQPSDADDLPASDSSNTVSSNHVTVDRDVDYGAMDVPDPTTDDWLFVEGNKIVDKDGNEVWLTGINWFGYNTGTNTFDGLWAGDMNTSIQEIANHGFNVIRVPFSAELILQWSIGEYPQANFNQATNDYLVGMDSLQIFEYFLGQARANGLKVIIDIHSAETNASGHMINLWYTEKISRDDYLFALSWMADRYKNDDTIIAYDLKNEPHGKHYEGDAGAIWNDSTKDNNWKYVAELAADAVLSKNPNVLVLVEGIEIYPKDIKANGDYASQNEDDYYYNWWGGNLRGVADYPVDLGEYQNKLLYSPHDYGPTVYAQPWFEGDFTYDSLMEDCWYENWLYIHKENIAPLLIGEWGGFMKEPNLKWMTYMRQLIGEYKLHHTFWCFNANSGDTGGMVLDDFTTWDEEKYTFVKEVLWNDGEHFIGLDHEIPLGINGISLGDYY